MSQDLHLVLKSRKQTNTHCIRSSIEGQEGIQKGIEYTEISLGIKFNEYYLWHKYSTKKTL